MSTTRFADARLPEGGAPQPYRYGDEISLFDLWNVLVRRRWWAVGVFVVVLLTAVAHLMATPSVYESRAVVRLGEVAGSAIASTATVAVDLRESYRIGEPGREPPYLTSVESKSDRLLVLKASAFSSGEAREYLTEVISDLRETLGQRYATAIRFQEEALATVEAQAAQLDGQIERLLAVAEGGQAPEAVRALVVLQQASLQDARQRLESRRAQLVEGLSPLKTRPTRLVREPTAAEVPVQPRPVLTLALAVVLGGVFGILSAFVVEFVRRARQRRGAEELLD